MASVEERIQRQAKVPFDSKGFPLFADSLNYWRGLGKVRGLGEVTEKSLLRNGWVKVEEVLQILKEKNEKWRELLKLLQKRPKLKQDYDGISMFFVGVCPISGEQVEKYLQKIEGKLKELRQK